MVLRFAHLTKNVKMSPCETVRTIAVLLLKSCSNLLVELLLLLYEGRKLPTKADS